MSPLGGRALAAWDRHRVVLRSWLLFVAMMAGFYGLVLFADGFWRTVNELTARSLASTLSLLGHPSRAVGARVESALFPVTVVRACTAVQPAVILVAAILAYPARVRGKLVGLAVGVPLIVFVNHGRLVSLCYLGDRYPQSFETVHLVVWQSLMVLLTVLIFVGWATWVGPDGRRR